MADQDTNKPSRSAVVRPDTLKNEGPEVVVEQDEVKLVEPAKPQFTEPTTYRANADGFLSGEGLYVRAGEVFTTTAPKGDWMDEISAKEAKALNAE